MRYSGWGRYPRVQSNVFDFNSCTGLKGILKKQESLIAYGNGRSYGDSALANNIVDTKKYDYFLDFDESNGLLRVQAGVMLASILDVFIPRGWFLKITPGTKLITVGGAIASDVHGKNHHSEGCFSESVKSFRIMLPDGEIIKCSKEENSEIFQATCGGMGLTGVILDVEIVLIKIKSKNINQTLVKAKNLSEAFRMFEKYAEKDYLVAWIDCLSKGESIGRCLLSVGEFSNTGDLDYQAKNKITIPFNFPSFALNRIVVKVFNFLYYRQIRGKLASKVVGVDSFFYPLDAISNWNKLYGEKGFVQYQFVLPKENSFQGLKKILELISSSGRVPTLAVLKLCGIANENYLSFPIEGYSLAIDFKIDDKLFDFLKVLDAVVLESGGRIYLAKDARMSKEMFESGYSKVDKFRALRKKYHLDKKINSLQSQRIGV